MKITFFGAARTVTGSCYLAEHQGVRFLVDCGLFQGSKALKERNYGVFPFNPGELDFMLLTHAHIDHSGLLPKLVKQGFKNPIYCSSATAALSEIMLPDSGYIQEMEVERKNRKLARSGQPLIEPIYTAEDALAVQPLMRTVKYGREFQPAPGLTVIYRDAGHILGSAMAEIHYQEEGALRRLVFTGDLGRNDQAIVRDPYVIKSADYLVMESTYGNRVHKGGMEEEIPHFTQVINDTFRQGGNVIIPAFTVDRTQDVLTMLYLMQKRRLIPDCTVYVDSPLAIKATDIFAKYPDYYDRFTMKVFHEEGKPPFMLDNLVYTHNTQESVDLNKVRKNAIIISASGMADAGRIKHHLKHNLWRPECAVVFFGYQAEGTLGRRLIDGEKKVTIHGESVDVKAQIHNMEGFSAHADRNEMLAWLGGFETLPVTIFLVHGEESAALDFAAAIKERFGVAAEVPYTGDAVELKGGVAVVEHGKESLQPEQGLREKIDTRLGQLLDGKDEDQLVRILDFLRRIS